MVNPTGFIIRSVIGAIGWSGQDLNSRKRRSQDLMLTTAAGLMGHFVRRRPRTELVRFASNHQIQSRHHRMWPIWRRNAELAVRCPDRHISFFTVRWRQDEDKPAGSKVW